MGEPFHNSSCSTGVDKDAVANISGSVSIDASGQTDVTLGIRLAAGGAATFTPSASAIFLTIISMP